MNGLKQYAVLVKTELWNAISLNRPKKEGGKAGSHGKKIVMLCIAAIAIIFWLCSVSALLTYSAQRANAQRDLIYAFILAAQSVVFFFGLTGGISTLYFSNDNALLFTFPVMPAVRFFAKFTVLYISEVSFSALFFLPMALTYGITLGIAGAGPSGWFYLLSVCNVFLIPAIPLLLISLLAVPIVTFVVFMRRIRGGKAILALLLLLPVIGMYAASAFVQFAGEEANFQVMASVLQWVHRFTPFNYWMAEAMLGVHPAGYFFAYLGEVLGIVAIAGGISALFYRRLAQAVMEGEGVRTHKKSRHTEPKRKERSEWTQKPIQYSFLFKEWRSLLSSPSMLISALLFTVTPVIMVVVISLSLRGESMGEEEAFLDFLQLAIVNMMSMVVSGSYTFATVPISSEGKNIYALKTMPIPLRAFLIGKLSLPITFSAIGSVLLAIALCFAMASFSPVVFFGTILLMLVHSYGMYCWELHSDLRNPHFVWNNRNELTQNNIRVLKPVLCGLGIGILQFIFGVLCGIFFTKFLYKELGFVIYYVAALIPSALFAVFGDRAIRKDAAIFYERMGE